MLQWDDLAQQTKGITKYVNYLIEKRSYSAGDILVLCPRRQIGYDIKDALNNIGITAHSFFSEESLEEDESQLAFILLCLLANNEDKVALRYWLGYGDKYWLEKEYRILRSHCEKSNQSPWETLNTIENGSLDLKGINKIEKRFKILLKSLYKLADFAGEDLVDALFPSKKSWAILMREAALSELEKETTAIELKEKLIIAITQPEVPETSDFVRVMSLYKAKGLTAKVTIITGVIQGLVPLILGDASADEKKESLKEQRRVLYVALTRPTEILVVSSIRMLQRELAHKMRAMVYKGVGAYGAVISSQFLDEMGPNAPDVVRGLEWQKKGFK
jgi:superfamily I DNA/RNA helicase